MHPIVLLYLTPHPTIQTELGLHITGVSEQVLSQTLFLADSVICY